MGAGVRPGDGENAWKLVIKSNHAELSKLVRSEVTKQLVIPKPAMVSPVMSRAKEKGDAQL